MSFRYTNSLIAVHKYRILLERGRQQLLQRKDFFGRVNGVTVVSDVYGIIQRISIPPEKRHLYYQDGDEEGNKIDTEKVSRDIQAAIFDIQQHIRNAKQIIHQVALSQTPELIRFQSFSRWFEEDGGSIAPLPHRSLQDHQLPPWMQAIRQATPEIARTHRALMPVLMLMEEKMGASRAAPPFCASLMAHQKSEFARQERNFWRKVDYIRRGQMNVIKGKKRPYEQYIDKTSSAGQEVAGLEKLDIDFAWK